MCLHDAAASLRAPARPVERGVVDLVFSASSASSVSSAALAVTAEVASSSKSQAPAEPGLPLPHSVAFGLALVLTASVSGGLCFGVTPFQHALRQFGYKEGDQATVVLGGFQIMIFGTGLAAPMLDVVGPRLFAGGGLVLEFVGHVLMSRVVDLNSSGMGPTVLAIAYGLIGLGGNCVMIGSIQFSELFESSGTACSILSGAYQSAGFVFVILSLEGSRFIQFFQYYAVFTAACLVVVLLTFPDEPCSRRVQPRCFRPLQWPKCNAASICSPSELRQALSALPLNHLRTWCFLLGFSFTATTALWGANQFGIVVLPDGDPCSLGIAKQGCESGELKLALARYMPLVANSTFFVTPFVGIVIDRMGFAVPVAVSGVLALAFTLSLIYLPLPLQWFTLVELNLLQANVFAIQLSYIAQTFPLTQFGAFMSMSNFVQSAVNPISLDCDAKQALSWLGLPSLVICAVWASVQWRLRKQGLEMVATRHPSEHTASWLNLRSKTRSFTGGCAVGVWGTELSKPVEK